jgi:hypothetical protein
LDLISKTERKAGKKKVKALFATWHKNERVEKKEDID